MEWEWNSVDKEEALEVEVGQPEESEKPILKE